MIGPRFASSSCARWRPTHGRCVRLGDYIGIQFGLVGFVMLPAAAVGRHLDGVDRLSPSRPGGDPAVDLRPGAVRLFFLEIDHAAGRRYLADVPVARGLCRDRHQQCEFVTGRPTSLDGQSNGQIGQHCRGQRDRLRRAGIFILRRGALESDRQIRSNRRRGELSAGSRQGRRPNCGKPMRPGLRPRTTGRTP